MKKMLGLIIGLEIKSKTVRKSEWSRKIICLIKSLKTFFHRNKVICLKLIALILNLDANWQYRIVKCLKTQ